MAVARRTIFLSLLISSTSSLTCLGDYADEVLKDNPIAYYRFEEDAGSDVVLDSSGFGNDSLELANAILGVPGRVGRGVEFNGDGSILLDFSMDPFDPQGADFDFSIEMFVNSTGIPTQVMASQQDGAGLGRSNLILTGGGQWGSFIGGGTTSTEITPEPDTWYHLVMTYDGDFTEIMYYVDGEATVDPIVQVVEGADGNWVLGAHKLRDRQFVDGIMDEVAFYDYRLDDPNGDDDIEDSRVQAHFAAAPELVSELLGDCDGTGILDASDLACITTIEERDAVVSALNTLPGDFDGVDGVGFPDFLVLSSNFGAESGGYSDGNIDLSDGVGFPDFLILSANFGQTAAAASVPEPNGQALLIVGLIAALHVRQRQRVC